MRILFVCLGNICRSPTVEGVARHLAAREAPHLGLEFDSAGTAGYHIGKAPDRRMIQAARGRGLSMRGRARQVKPEDFEAFDWIFAMDRSNYEDLLRVRERCAQPTARLVSFCDFCEGHDLKEVPDPYYGGPEGFEVVLDLLEDGCASFLRRWRAGELD